MAAPITRLKTLFFRSIITVKRSCFKCDNFVRSCSSTNTSHLSTYSDKSHTCGELRLNDVGKRVTLCGWLQYHRAEKFVILRDWHGSVQTVVVNNTKLDKINFESVVKVEGEVRARPDSQTNKNMATGEIEVAIDKIEILNQCVPILPFEIKDFHKKNESLRMQYRFLDIRQTMMQRNLRLRSQVVTKMREFLSNKHNFVDIETPTLFCKTPGGAQEFVVPTQSAGKFYSLPQSPQQFKQLLMVGGIDRYYQIARCYRDEGGRGDRQPEFTQVDIEMSFVNQDNVIKLVEDLLSYVWPCGKLPTPFPRYTYQQVMSEYGVDKPDTRFDIKLQNVTELLSGKISIFDPKSSPDIKNSIQMIVIPQGADKFTSKAISSVIDSARKVTFNIPVLPLKYNKDKTWSITAQKYLNAEDLTSFCESCGIQPNDLFILTSGRDYKPHSVLGKIRLNIATFLEEMGEIIRDPKTFNFLWVYDFPLFLPKEDYSGIESAHHPFTAPDPNDDQLIYTNPLQVKGQHYDLVLNGNEIGGGSIRIHNSKLQKYVLEDILKEDSTPLNHLLTALDFGCPPHGGIALGLDRLMAIICNANSIRDVIAFPKSTEGRDLMCDAPSLLTKDQLDMYHIRVKK